MIYDFVIVGGGSAGCVLANRLSADPTSRVLLLEAGSGDRHPWLKIPAGFARVFLPNRFNWSYHTEAEPELDNRRIYWPRGKVLGGSSAINAMVYMRGHANDYDCWRALGNEGWGWDDVLPLFERLERHEDEPGSGAALTISDPLVRHPASTAFIAAAREAGIGLDLDFERPSLDGVGFLKFTICNGVRHSSASAFLRPALGRQNLHVLTNAHVTRLHFEGSKVTGLSYRKKGVAQQVKAHQVILAAGAINSPHILMLSGIGPAEHLRAFGIDVVLDKPGVGQNLHDHLYVGCTARTRPAGSMNGRLRGWGLAGEVATYLTSRRGALALGASQVSAFVRSGPEAATPDLQINFMPLSYSFTPDGRIVPDAEPGLTASVAHLQPHSRGQVSLLSPDPLTPPAMRANYLQSPHDQRAIVAGIRWIRRVLAQPSLSALIVEQRVSATTDQDMLNYARANGGSLFHPVGTCRMGQDQLAVVDERLRVHGIDGLRVADASIMPVITSGNTNAPAILIGEKAADLILQDSH